MQIFSHEALIRTFKKACLPQPHVGQMTSKQTNNQGALNGKAMHCNIHSIQFLWRLISTDMGLLWDGPLML